MPAFSRVKTWASGEILTAADLNGEFDNIISNFTLSNLDDYSVNEAQMQSVADPGTPGSASLATSLAGELQRLRYMLKAIHGGAQWYATTLTGWITTAMLGANSVTEPKIADAAVGTDQLIDASVTTAKLADGSVTNSKLAVSKAAARQLLTWTQPTSGATTYAMLALTRANNVGSAQFAAPPTITVGQQIQIAGATTTSFNGQFIVTGLNGNLVYFYNPGADATATIGAGTFTALTQWTPKDVQLSVNTIQRASNVVTVVFTAGQMTGRVGQYFALYNTTGAATGFDGLHKITEVVSNTTLKFAQTGPDETGTPATGKANLLMGCALTTNSGRSAVVNVTGGHIDLTATGTNAITNVYMAKFVTAATGDFSNLASNVGYRTFGQHSVLSGITLSPATSYVSTSETTYNSTFSEVLSASATGYQHRLYIPIAMNQFDYEPTAGAQSYFTILSSSSYATQALTVSNFEMLAYEF